MGERLQRCVEYFSEILNRDVPMNPVEEDGEEELDEIRDIDLGRWQIREVKNIGCVMSGFLFLNVLALDWIKKKATADKRRLRDMVEFHNSVGGL